MTGKGAEDHAGGGESARAALRFIDAVRRDEALRQRVSAVVAEGRGLSGIVDVAAGSGFVIGVEDLRTAFAADWGLRRAFYLRD